MPVSNGASGGVPNMNLKAWAYVSAAGVLLRSQNVASVSKYNTGAYTVTFAQALGSVNYVGRVVLLGKLATGQINATTVLLCDVSIKGTNGADADSAFYVEFYE